MIRFLCDAIPFCYGPGAALETLLKELLTIETVKLPIDVLASGTTKELLSITDLPIRLLDIDSENPKSLATVRIQEYDVFLNVCNPLSFDHLSRKASIPIVYVDFLLWMHSDKRKSYFDADLYLAENYPGTLEWKENWGDKIKNLLVIPPLISIPNKKIKPELSYLLVGLGGQISKLTKPGINTQYPTFVISQVVNVLKKPLRFKHILVTGPKSVIDDLRILFSKFSHIEFASLSHGQFLNELSRCELFLSHPGLYAPFEAMMSGVPTGFLPPSNYTQILQLRHFRRNGIADYSYSWEDTFKNEIPANLPETEGVAKVLEQIRYATNSPDASEDLQENINRFIDLATEELKLLGSKQQEQVVKYGTEGPTVAVTALRGVLKI